MRESMEDLKEHRYLVVSSQLQYHERAAYDSIQPEKGKLKKFSIIQGPSVLQENQYTGAPRRYFVQTDEG